MPTNDILPMGRSPFGIPESEVTVLKETKLCLRVSDAEKTQIMLHAREHHMTISAYMIHCALADEYGRTQEDNQLITELRRIGININQIAKQLNQGTSSIRLGSDLIVLGKNLKAYCKDLLAERKTYTALLGAYQKAFLSYLESEKELKTIKMQQDVLRLELRKLRARNRR